MGIIETEYMDIREIRKQLDSGKIDNERALVLMKIYSELGKRVDQTIKLMCLDLNHGAKASKLVNSKNLLSSGTAMQADAPMLEEKVKCPEKGDLLVCRQECLDYSGDSRHIDACQKCDQFSITRKQICP